MSCDGRNRVVIENLKPCVSDGYPIKRIAGDTITVTADIFADGHDPISAELLYRKSGEQTFQTVPMRFIENDRWEGRFKVSKIGRYEYTVSASIRPGFVSQHKILPLVVDRTRARFSAWYERFPRSCSDVPGQQGTLADLTRLIPEISEMGFNVLYLPPIHPIGTSHRKGKNNTIQATPNDVGSPWAIGSKEGGHTAIDPQLGTFEDFAHLVKTATQHRMEIALDFSLQCSPDHPYIQDHPEWFKWRPDGTIQYAENPPKKYPDIVPFNFESDDWEELWAELKNIVLFWIKQGVKIFRVDNPHTKPFAFWEWLIPTIKDQYPDVLFLAEAFTRPKIMYRLAKIGFSQSYTYFTWRVTKQDLTAYMRELTTTPLLYNTFRPNFWPNTPDILAPPLRHGSRSTFMMRFVLASTLSSNYGIYGPAFELCVNQPLDENPTAGNDEYRDSEKYEIKTWGQGAPGNIKFIAKINQIRKENIEFQTTFNLTFYETNNDHLLAYGKGIGKRRILIVVNLNPDQTQSGMVRLHNLSEMGITQPFHVHDLLTDKRYVWTGEYNYVELSPDGYPAHIFRIESIISPKE